MRREDIFYITDKRDYVLNGLTSNVYIIKYMNKETEKKPCQNYNCPKIKKTNQAK